MAELMEGPHVPCSMHDPMVHPGRRSHFTYAAHCVRNDQMIKTTFCPSLAPALLFIDLDGLLAVSHLARVSSF